ncbi:hypothetical protein [Hymenobacter persicinus]|uniref:VOC family protein n=1 Tax=Hymenobacter persicinus TaxID=2025506 RepID=A0A4Q5L999_9BACT|nr:hypothetical protein [Hymenobacter persicinus]RYU76408.1 hypothetical protein EWM57_18715 [Hymenobacter persicinus]
MKNNVVAATTLLLAGTALLVSRRRHKHPRHHNGLAAATKRPGTQKEVVYVVKDLKEAIEWFTIFFATDPQKVVWDADDPYAEYLIDQVLVRLATGPKFLRLDKSVFYWVLPGPTDVEAKFDELRVLKNTRIEHRLDRVQEIGHRKEKEFEACLDENQANDPLVNEVLSFVVITPDDNRVGVVNNPIYPPK